MNRLFRIFLISVALLPLTMLAQNASNVVARQNGNKIEVTYSLDKEADTKLYVVIDGTSYLCRSVSGDIGTNVSAGRNTAVWDVLQDMEKLQGNVAFKIQANTSTRARNTYSQQQYRKQERAKRSASTCPLAGFEFNAGVYGFGGDIYWPWTLGRGRLGSYVGYTYCLKDWFDSDIDGTHEIFFGMSVALSKHCIWFVAPGLGISTSEKEVTTKETYWDYDYTITNTRYNTSFKFAMETGFAVRFLRLFMASVHISYPMYVGVGLGFEFSGY